MALVRAGGPQTRRVLASNRKSAAMAATVMPKSGNTLSQPENGWLAVMRMLRRSDRLVPHSTIFELHQVESYRRKEAARQPKIQRDNEKAQRRRQSIHGQLLDAVHRPDRHPGRFPPCYEVLPGNNADNTTLRALKRAASWSRTGTKKGCPRAALLVRCVPAVAAQPVAPASGALRK